MYEFHFYWLNLIGYFKNVILNFTITENHDKIFKWINQICDYVITSNITSSNIFDKSSWKCISLQILKFYKMMASKKYYIDFCFLKTFLLFCKLFPFLCKHNLSCCLCVFSLTNMTS